jgi:Holliday junction resolvase RusA-like endonuclease
VTALTFHLACIPPKTAHHHKRIVHIGDFSRMADRPELVQAKRFLEELLIPHQPPETIKGPVVVTVTYVWPWLASHSKKVRALGLIPHTSKPDLTNVTKTLEDRLCELCFIEDDRMVVDLYVRKRWGNEPGITVTITPFAADSIANTEPPTWRADEALPLLNEVR